MVLTNWFQKFNSKFSSSVAYRRRTQRSSNTALQLAPTVERLEDKTLLSGVLASVEREIATATDDAEERDDGVMSLYSGDLEMVEEGRFYEQVTGLRFTNISIPDNALIRRAYIQFTANEASSDVTNLEIHGELTPNSETFDGESLNITSRAKTANSVAWSVGSWNVAGEREASQRTPDLTAIIQELTLQDGWVDGNAMTFILDGDGFRSARSFDNASGGTPTLHIDYVEDDYFQEKQFIVTHAPRLQQGDAPLEGFGFAGSNTDQVDIVTQTQETGISGANDTFEVVYRKVGADDWTQLTEWEYNSTGVPGVDVNIGTLSGLEFDTDYEYRIRQYIDSGVMTDEWHETFHTRLRKGDSSEFTFAALGNSTANPISEVDALTQSRLVQSRINESGAAFSLLLGNNINPGGSYADADGHFDHTINPEVAEFASTRIEYAARGFNDFGSPTEQYFSSPMPVEGVTSPFYVPVGEPPEANYSFDYGDTHFATFNSLNWNNQTQLDEVLDWLEKDMLASVAQWKVVYTDLPVGGAADIGLGPSDDYFHQVVTRLHAAGVDLLLTGESTNYSYTYPMQGENEGVAQFTLDQDRTYEKGVGLVQVVSGVGGGALAGGSFATMPYVASGYSTSTARSSEHGFTQVEVTKDALVVKYVAADDGEVIDSFTIREARYELPSVVDIDGDFSDWEDVPAYYDAFNDTHDTDTEGRDGEPVYREHPDVDLLEYKVTHDNENLYIYFRAAGEIGETQVENNQLGLRAGRYYVIATIDVDNDDSTGYWLDDGGYYPTTNGYDMNAEIEYFNGEFNTGHYLNHGAIDEGSLLEAFSDQTNGDYIPGFDGPYAPGFVDILPGSYDYYSQWVYDDKGTETDFDDDITFVVDRGPIVLGILKAERSEDLHELEMVAPFKGFLKDENGNPIVDFGSILDISISLEASGELAPGQDWASDTGDPIENYVITETPYPDATFGFGASPIVDEDSGFHEYPEFMFYQSGYSGSEFVLTYNNVNLFEQAPVIDFETGDLTFEAAGDATGVSVVTITELVDGEERGYQKFTIYVQPLNDPPVAEDDSYEVYWNSTDNFFDPKVNDSTAPDPFENVEIVSVQHFTDQGGTVEIVDGELSYTPKPTFFGTDTFEYTISDGTDSGVLDTATVTVNVNFIDTPNIVIDGNMDDWDNIYIDTYFDAEDDTHDTDHKGRFDTPGYVDHPNSDLLEYRVTSDAENLYFYFRAKGDIGATTTAAQGRAGRYYAIVTLDVDDDNQTGYWLNEGGYYPTTNGYDMNAEVEFYDGEFNTGHYINHGAQNSSELLEAFLEQSDGDYVNGFDGPYNPGYVEILPGSYDYYTQWVYQENDPNDEEDDTIVFVLDKGPVVLGNIQAAVSADGHALEMIAPFKGFMKDENGVPIVDVGSILDLSFSLEASGELSNEVTADNPNGEWASDTGDPIDGYVVQGYRAPFPYAHDFENNNSDYFIPVTGDWTTANGQLTVESDLEWYKLGANILDLEDDLPEDFIVQTQINIDPTAGQASNGFIIFDYESAEKFKYAGLGAGQNKLIIGEYNKGWNSYEVEFERLNNRTDYDLEIRVEGSVVTLSLAGLTRLSHDFGEALNDNPLGIGAYNSRVHFDDFRIGPHEDGTPKLAFPFAADQGQDLEETMYSINGNWTTADDFAVGNSVGFSDPKGIALFNTETTLPADFEISTTMSASIPVPGMATNGYIVFDYHSSTNFKFASAMVGQNRWVIGEVQNGWNYVTSTTETLNPGVFYSIHLDIEGSVATLSKEGVILLQHDFGESLNDGLAGFMVYNAETRFEDIQLGVDLNAVPAPIAAAVASDLSIAGGLNGTVAQGTVVAPNTIEVDTTGAGSSLDGVVLGLNETLPENYALSTSLLAAQGLGVDQNGFIAFNYLAADNFNFAGVWLAANKWVIGRNDGVYQELASVTDLSIDPDANYDLELKVIGNEVKLFANGVEKVSHTFASAQNLGALGLASSNSLSTFGDLEVTELSASDSVFAGAIDDLLV